MKILVIEDDPDYAVMIRADLAAMRNPACDVKLVDNLKEGLDILTESEIDVILTDLGLPDSAGLDTVAKINEKAPTVPIVVLTGCDDDQLAMEAVRKGAQDYLVKGQVRGKLLVRILYYAMERKKAERELKIAQLHLIQAEKMESVGRLAAGVAHEVKNPLAIILMGTNYLLRKYQGSDQDTAAVLEEIDEAVKRADAVIRGLLNFSAARDLVMNKEDLNSVIEQSLFLVRHEMVKNHVHLVKDLTENLPPIRLDRNKIEQVLVNILMNAIHSMPNSGTLTVRSYVKQLDKPGNGIGHRKADRFKVGDTVLIAEIEDIGPGISFEHLSKIFDPFFTTKPTGKGTGLGLTVSRKIVDLHNGMLEIKNKEVKGVRGTIMLKMNGGLSYG